MMRSKLQVGVTAGLSLLALHTASCGLLAWRVTALHIMCAVLQAVFGRHLLSDADPATLEEAKLLQVG